LLGGHALLAATAEAQDSDHCGRNRQHEQEAAEEFHKLDANDWL